MGLKEFCVFAQIILINGQEKSFLHGVQSVLKVVNEVFRIRSLEQDVNYPIKFCTVYQCKL